MHGNLKEEYFSIFFQPYLEADQTIFITIIGNEVTEQVIAKAKIQESKEQFQAAIAAGRHFMDQQCKRRNGRRAARLGFTTGQTYEEYQGYGWTNAVHPDDTQPTVEAWNEAVKQRKIFIFEHRVKRKDGQWRNFSSVQFHF
jgi:PAS domain-containing protein